MSVLASGLPAPFTRARIRNAFLGAHRVPLSATLYSSMPLLVQACNVL